MIITSWKDIGEGQSALDEKWLSQLDIEDRLGSPQEIIPLPETIFGAFEGRKGANVVNHLTRHVSYESDSSSSPLLTVWLTTFFVSFFIQCFISRFVYCIP